MEGVIDQLVHNQFPALVYHPDGTMSDRCRAVLTPKLLVLYGESTEGGQRRVRTKYKADIVEARPEGNGWLAIDTEGGEWKITRGAWCGCGSPLKTMPMPIPIDI